MPILATKLLIYATRDGLILRLVGANHERNEDIQVAYGTRKISHVKRTDDRLLDLVETSHLICITRREQVAQIQGKAIYAVRDVTLISLTSQSEAEKAIGAAQKALKQDRNDATAGDQTEESDVGEDEDFEEPRLPADEEKAPEAAALEPPKGPAKKTTTFAKSAVQAPGRYGRFATRWFSKGGSGANARDQQGLSAKNESAAVDDKGQPEDSSQDDRQDAATQDLSSDAQEGDRTVETDAKASGASVETSKGKGAIESLTPRIIRSARLYFSTSGFYYSYEHDLSGTLMQKSTQVSDVPLWKRFDELSFWNRHLVDPFVNARCDELVLPLMQGFVGQRAFSITKTDDSQNDAVADAVQDPEAVLGAQATPSQTQLSDDGSKAHEFLLTLISRRSVKRAGLRYMRRGIDDDGNVANTVETEQVLSTMTWKPSDKAFSLIQTRGSIPMHFSQSPYSFKPTPVTFGSEATNQAAFKKHFTALSTRYGSIQVVCLVDKHGTPEVTIGELFENHAKLLNDSGGANGKPIGFEWFDFHGACKGMKFENVSILMDTLDSTLNSYGYIVKQHDRNIKQQTGVLRTNCMDCLDRTNVVQSAVAGWALQQQLSELDLIIDLKKDPKTQWFNTLWADNGDAISRQYAGTAALKGDFTRTRKRNWTGALSDFSLTLNRYYNNIFGDYFLQACIDYYLGNARATIFDDFQTDMMSKDNALDMRRIRQNAIDTCVKIVLEDPNEKLIAGWTLSCSKDSNTLRTLPFEECVVLLTKAAFYFCRFDWNTEKVGSFERVDLLDIEELWTGAYVTSALGPTHLDETKNVGFALRYNTRGKSVVRTNTRSLRTEDEVTDEKEAKNEPKNQKEPEKEEKRLLAFKMLPPDASAAQGDSEHVSNMTETDLAKHVCHELRRAMVAAFRRDDIYGTSDPEKVPQVQEKDVVSVADAKRSTGYIESIGYGLKRLVWS
ncbi:hypothetical protein LTR37_006118 [Vermiconidia calcicola]|uniref:Uncharacterized protein n=1 Tax=Vermiconidia calcicola TaxID=1690605 RepID=A0ACC3NIL3_9PEZI|nr:hypothetical protein LTR37_006118 [Vermiconidia calcicola]